MNALERLRPEPRPLDPEWSVATLQSILASGAPDAVRRRPRLRRPVLASAIAAGTAASAVVIGVATLGTSAAFAVEQAGNGDLLVTIHRLSDPAGLERALGAHGIQAQVTYLHTETPSALDDGSGPSPCAPGQAPGAVVDPDEGGFTITFDRAYLAEHRDAELSLTAAGGASADDWSGLLFEWSDGRC